MPDDRENATLATGARPRKRLPLWLAVVGAAVLAAISAAGPRGFRQYQRLRQDAISLGAKNAALAIENRQLKQEIRQLRDTPKAIERTAREDLGMVARDEVVFTFE